MENSTTTADDDDVDVDREENNVETATKNSTKEASAKMDLDGKLRELNDTLSKLKKESTDEIQKLKQKSEDASKTIATLQQKLQQQSDYDVLKKEIQWVAVTSSFHPRITN